LLRLLRLALRGGDALGAGADAARRAGGGAWPRDSRRPRRAPCRRPPRRRGRLLRAPPRLRAALRLGLGAHARPRGGRLGRSGRAAVGGEPRAARPDPSTLFRQWLPKATYPSRLGIHGNSAFGLARALPFARASDPAL